MIRVVILYDSIMNSVFESQVLMPLLKSHQQTYLISFEPKPIASSIMQKIAHECPQVRVIIFKRFPFVGAVNLWLASLLVKIKLKKLSTYEMIARGPLAGFIAQKARTKNCIKLTIQARGLLAEEYAYTSAPLSWWCKIRYYIFKHIEKKVYAQTDCCIEVVSIALGEYLIKECGAQATTISLAQHDIPHQFAAATIAQWRTETRKELHIPESAVVYCYNGSAKPWQCPRETLAYFKQQKVAKPHAFLLILTHDIDQFQHLVFAHNIDEKDFRICSVPHAKIYSYLAAADKGMLLREKHIVNWVSRPTKALEYKAVGLEIIHNDTVQILTDSHSR